MFGKEYACNARELGSIPVLGRSPGGGQDDPLQYSCLENLHGERNPAGYSPWGCKESDTTEHIYTVRHTGRIYRGLNESGQGHPHPSCYSDSWLSLGLLMTLHKSCFSFENTHVLLLPLLTYLASSHLSLLEDIPFTSQWSSSLSFFLNFFFLIYLFF